MAGEWSNIPGTTIPSMRTTGGIYARTVGLRETAKKVNTAISAIHGVTILGLLEAAAEMRRDMEVTSPTIPIGKPPKGTGNLRASWFVHEARGFTHPTVMAGFDGAVANYAIYVHEMTEPPYNDVTWSRPGSGPKFLEKALIRNQKKIVAIVAANIKASLK